MNNSEDTLEKIEKKAYGRYLQDYRTQKDISKIIKNKKYEPKKIEIQKVKESFFELLQDIVKNEGHVEIETFQDLVLHINKNYTFIKLIGIGGESVVIVVQDNILHRKNVVKIALPFFQGTKKKTVWVFSLARFNTDREETEMKRRFLRGCKIQAELSQICKKGIVPNILRISKNPLFFEMPYLEAEGFLKNINSNNLRQNLTFFLKLLDFINEIHSFFIIHRDIKPGNILITKEGVPVLLDFTTSKMLNDTKLTTPGLRIGSPIYASKTQMTDAKEVTFVDDIYSLGLIFWIVITKKEPEPLLSEDILDNSDKKKFIKRLENELNETVKIIFQKAMSLQYQTIQPFWKEIRNYLDFIMKKYKDTIIGKQNLGAFTEYPKLVQQFIKVITLIKENKIEK